MFFCFYSIISILWDNLFLCHNRSFWFSNLNDNQTKKGLHDEYEFQKKKTQASHVCNVKRKNVNVIHVNRFFLLFFFDIIFFHCNIISIWTKTKKFNIFINVYRFGIGLRANKSLFFLLRVWENKIIIIIKYTATSNDKWCLTGNVFEQW